ncbi:chlorohydrolase [Streptococcus pneumoniae]|nr:chlorohydrolase [Streptococcus pneumoniae]
MKIKEQTRKLAAGCSKHCFEVMDRTGAGAQNTVLRFVDNLTKVS